MSEKTMTFVVDLMPDTTSTRNLGSSSVKWKLNGVVPGGALGKDVTDNTTSTAPSSTDQNLITGRTLYNAIASTSEVDALFE